jgi:hypothetical protein
MIEYAVDTDIDPADAADMVDRLMTKLSDNDVETDNSSVVFVNYSSFDNSENYMNNIMNKLQNYSNTVTFAGTKENVLSESEMKEEYERIQKIAEKNNVLPDGFNNILMNGELNKGNLTMEITFVQ